MRGVDGRAGVLLLFGLFDLGGEEVVSGDGGGGNGGAGEIVEDDGDCGMGVYKRGGGLQE